MFEQGEGGMEGRTKNGKTRKFALPQKNPSSSNAHTHTVSSTKMGSPPTDTVPPPKKYYIAPAFALTVGNDGRQAAQPPGFLRCMCMSPGKRLRGHVRMIHG